MNKATLNKIVQAVFITLIVLFSNSIVIGQTHIVPTSASTTAGEFGGSTIIENIYNEATGFSDPLTDAFTNTCSVASPIPYISGSGITTGTLTVGIPSSSIDALHIWNGWSTDCELNHSLNNITLEFFSGGVSIATEVLTVPMPDGSGFGFVVPFLTSYPAIDEVTIEVNSLHGGNEIGIIELGFRVGESCEELTTTVSSTDICVGEEVTLEAASEIGGTITWSDGVVDGVPFRIDAEGVYTYTATSDDPLDCEFEVEITVHGPPEVVAAVDEEIICLGQSV
ncbi:hypothetical protein, partial [Crocinitomix catalasitica]|uniref:hypothetical protein n=1 Tax=Crocinitomix catalasitica TaxID=184607 RepID=UPI00055D1E1D